MCSASDRNLAEAGAGDPTIVDACTGRPRAAHALGVRAGLARAWEELEREEATLARIMKIRFYPFVLNEAEGVYLTDLDGNVYLDFAAAGAVMNVGYRNPRIVAAVASAAEGPWSTTSAIFAHRAQTTLAHRLSHLVPGDSRVWFGTSGSEAMDTIGRYFRTASGRPRLISFLGSFHGQTGGSGALSGMASHADIPSAHITKVPFPYPYRCPSGPCRLDGCSLACLDPLRRALKHDRNQVAGIVTEPIQSDGGDVVPPANVLPELRELADRHGTWLGIDEVKMGMGRTGRMFAYQHAGIVPDAVGMGKALAGGLPLSAVIARPEILDARTGSCAYTLAGSPIPCAAALATLDELEQRNLAENAATIGARLLDGLREIQRSSPVIGDVRGQGLAIGVELVRDRSSREPAADLTACVVYRCFQLGLVLIYTGVHGNVLELTPPLTIGAEEADTALATIERALADAVRGNVDLPELARFQGW